MSSTSVRKHLSLISEDVLLVLEQDVHVWCLVLPLPVFSPARACDGLVWWGLLLVLVCPFKEHKLNHR